MSGWKEPVGPKSKSVYVRRRILVLLGLLALVAAAVLIILKPGSIGGAATNPTVNVPAGVSDANQVETGDSGDGKQAGKTAECRSDLLEVTPITDRDSYAAGEHPKLSLSIVNTGKKSCTADLGTAGMVFAVTSGTDQVWVSTDCQKSPDHREVILEPGKKLTTEPITWDRTRSSKKTCDVSREPVVAGGASYHLDATAAGVESTGTVQFLLY